MNKAIALAALTAIAFGNESFGENEFNVLKTVGNGLKKVGHFVEEHPQVITQGAKLLSHHDDEYFNIHDTIHKAEEGVHKAEHYVYDHRQQIKDGAKKGINYIAEHPEVVNKAIEIIKNLKHHDDEELFKIGKAVHEISHAVGKVEHVAKDGLNLYKNVQTGNLGGIIHDGKSLVQDVKHHDDEELFKIGHVVHEVAHTVGKVEHVAKDGLNMYKDYQTGNYIGLVKDGVKTVKDVKHHDDEELFKIGHALHEVGHVVGKVEHVAKDGLNVYKDVQTGNIRGLIHDGSSLVKDVKHHDDEELFNLDAFLNDAVRTYNDARQQPRNYGNLVNDGISLVKDIKQKNHDDEELFNIHNTVHKVEDGAKKAGHYVAEHPEVINKAIDLIKAIRQHDDEELFKVGHAIHNVAHTVGKVEHVAKDGLNMYKDYQTGNYIGLVKDGAKTVKDVKHHDDEELFKLDAFLNDAVRTYNDVRQQPRNYGNIVNDGISLVKDIKQKNHDDEELFNLDAFLNDAVRTYNDARQQPRNYGNLVNDGISLVKDIKEKKHDDEELFNLKNTVHNVGHVVGKVEHVVKDGLNVYKDVQTGNLAGLVHDGKSLVHDVKHHDDEELFNLGNLINDGIHIVKDVKTHNYGGLVNDGIQTVKDVKEAKRNLRH